MKVLVEEGTALNKERHHGNGQLTHVGCFCIGIENGCRYFGRSSATDTCIDKSSMGSTLCLKTRCSRGAIAGTDTKQL